MKCPNCGGITEVRETRALFDQCVSRRTRDCQRCELRFNTYEIGDALWGTISKHMQPHSKAVVKRRGLTLRNLKIAERLKAGEKHLTISIDFNLSPNMVSTIARRMGIPSKRMRKPLSTHVSAKPRRGK